MIHSRRKAYGSDQALTAARETMLSVRLESGDRWAFPYSYLTSMSYEKIAEKLTLTFNTHRVIIQGERLHYLYQDLLGHAVQFVQVTGGDVEPETCNIISMAVEELQPLEFSEPDLSDFI